MAGGDAAICVEGLTKYYGAVIGIEDLSFTVAPGEVYGFLGANGAGKTTTIRLLLDLLRPTRGRASVLGIDCHRDSLAARRRIGYLPGDLPIYPDLSARQYLEYLARLDSRPVPPDYLQHLLTRFAAHGLPHETFALPCGHYSTGMTPFKFVDAYVLIRFLRRHL